jgi:hypothetical protein
MADETYKLAHAWGLSPKGAETLSRLIDYVNKQLGVEGDIPIHQRITNLEPKSEDSVADPK